MKIGNISGKIFRFFFFILPGKARGTHARGKSEEVLGDFTFLYIPLNFYVHLLSLGWAKLKTVT
jgi:hypothetical protein